MNDSDRFQRLEDKITWPNRLTVIDRLFCVEGKTIDEMIEYLSVPDEQIGVMYRMIGMATAIRLDRVSPAMV